jgi:hypothetical protein
MSRAVELIEQFVIQARQGEVFVREIRLFNELISDPQSYNVKLDIFFHEEKLDRVFLKCLLNVGAYSNDVFRAHKSNGEIIEGINLIDSEEKIHKLSIIFTREKKHVTPPSIIESLQSKTIFGLPSILFRSFPIANLKIYFGASQQSLQLLRITNHQLQIHENHGYIIEETSESCIEFIYIDRKGNLVSQKKQIRDYLEASTSTRLARHAYSPKRGLKCISMFPEALFLPRLPLFNSRPFRTAINSAVLNELDTHTAAQVRRISQRIQSAQQRSKLTLRGIELAPVPTNELETILLFQKITLTNPDLLPGGLKVEILDYSPKDIDAVCRFQIDPNYPEEIGPVEFEYSLANFFHHGHDYRQVKLIICYTLDGLTFPYLHGGMTYDIDRSGLLPKLFNNQGDCSLPCLIMQDLLI